MAFPREIGLSDPAVARFGGAARVTFMSNAWNMPSGNGGAYIFRKRSPSEKLPLNQVSGFVQPFVAMPHMRPGARSPAGRQGSAVGKSSDWRDFVAGC
jgi:hypothetical protein